MSDQFTVALCQMTSIDDAEANLMQVESLVETIPDSAGVRLVCFPENCLYLRLREGEKVPGLYLEDKVFESLGELARRRKMHFHLGALPLRIDGHLYNSSVHVTDRGDVKASYQKMHLFDIQLENGPSVRESDAFRHGQAPSILEIDGWKFGQTICYDLRFAELFSTYARREVDGILVPSSFLVKTGEAHWEVLLRARAIESQCYILAAAQAGLHKSVHDGFRETYGHSLVVDPWGAMKERLATKTPGVLIHTLQRGEIDKVRRQIPMKYHRRLPIPP